MATNPNEPGIHIAAIHFGIPTVWTDEFETSDHRGERVIVFEWTGAIDDHGNVMEDHRYATGYMIREDGERGDRLVHDLDVPQPSNVKAAMDALHTE
jgi:hypothetical protein